MRKWIIILLCLFISGIKITAQQNFTLAKDKNGIRVWVGPVSGSKYYAFKAEMSLKASEGEILKILTDVRSYPDWFAFTSSVKLISQSDNIQQFLLETDYPWPYTNECMDYTMKIVPKQHNKLIIILTGSELDTNCKYSLKKASGYILLEAAGVNTNITFYFHSEPSQKIPPWLINPRIHEMPFQTFMALRRIINEN